jgi:MFS superfamily sulfate permease-like transporter
MLIAPRKRASTSAVVAGIVLAALLFMRRMAEVSGVELVPQSEHRERLQLPDHVLLFELAGPRASPRLLRERRCARPWAGELSVSRSRTLEQSSSQVIAIHRSWS